MRKLLIAGGFGALVLIAISGYTGYALGSEGDQPYTAKVVGISSSGDSLCIDRKEDSCGLPLTQPEDRDRIKVGSEVFIQDVWMVNMKTWTGPEDYRGLVFLVSLPASER